jgi:tetratricopeptide (TPR) repeat protein
LPAAGQKPKQTPPKSEQPAQQEPAEEDETLLPKTYTFNPIEAAKNAKVGEFYWKKGKYKAAALRFLEATRWDPGSADAWLRLGEAREKLGDRTAARAAYAKYLEVAPDGKDVATVRKRLESLPEAEGKKQ